MQRSLAQGILDSEVLFRGIQTLFKDVPKYYEASRSVQKHIVNLHCEFHIPTDTRQLKDRQRLPVSDRAVSQRLTPRKLTSGSQKSLLRVFLPEIFHIFPYISSHTLLPFQRRAPEKR